MAKPDVLNSATKWIFEKTTPRLIFVNPAEQLFAGKQRSKADPN
jgi:hypothetical protein